MSQSSQNSVIVINAEDYRFRDELRYPDPKDDAICYRYDVFISYDEWKRIESEIDNWTVRPVVELRLTGFAYRFSGVVFRVTGAVVKGKDVNLVLISNVRSYVSVDEMLDIRMWPV